MKIKKYNFPFLKRLSLPLTAMYFENVVPEASPKYRRFVSSPKVLTNKMPTYPFNKPISKLF